MGLQIGLKAVLKYKDKILLLKRVNSISRGGKWDLPGGLIETNEKLLEGLQREVTEETGLKISTVKVPLHIGYFNNNIYKIKNVIRIIYLCDTSSDKVELSPEHNDFKWIKIQEFRKMKPANFISPGVLTVLADRLEESERADMESFDIKINKSS